MRRNICLLFPDAPACSYEHARQALLQRGSPYVPVQVDTKDQSPLIREVVGSGRLNNFASKRLYKVLVRLGKARFLIEALDGLATFISCQVLVSNTDFLLESIETYPVFQLWQEKPPSGCGTSFVLSRSCPPDRKRQDPGRRRG